MEPAVVEQERRYIPYNLRVPFPVEVRCISEVPSGTRRYLAMNLGRGGLFLTTMLPLEPGTLIKCGFQLPDGLPPVVVHARVAWIRGPSAIRETPAGMGIRFLDLEDFDRSRIERFIGDQDY